MCDPSKLSEAGSQIGLGGPSSLSMSDISNKLSMSLLLIQEPYYKGQGLESVKGMRRVIGN